MDYNKGHHQHQKKKPEDRSAEGPMFLRQEAKEIFAGVTTALGFAVGFLFLPLISPEEGNAKTQEISHIFNMVGICLVIYAALLMLGFILLQSNVKFVKMGLNWFFLPAIAINYVSELMDVIK